MGIIILAIIFTIFVIRNEEKGESSIGKIIETIFGLGIMVIAFGLGAAMLMMIVSAIASL